MLKKTTRNDQNRWGSAAGACCELRHATSSALAPRGEPGRASMSNGLLVTLFFLAFIGGCIKAPDVVIVDRYTALEVQAAGDYAPLEDKLVAEGILFGPESYTSDEIVGGEEGGVGAGGLSGAYRGVLSRADRIDALRRRLCVGEAGSGLLVQRTQTCKGRIDEQDVANLLERENRNRRQIWSYMERQRPDASGDEIRTAWRTEYLKTVPCDSAIQNKDESWGKVDCT